MKLAGAELGNTLGNIVERYAYPDFNTGFDSNAFTGPSTAPQAPKPQGTRFDFN